MDFHFLMEQSFLKKLYIKVFSVIIDDLKALVRDILLKAYIYGSFEWCGFKNGLIADSNLVGNPDFYMLFSTSCHIFCAKNIS